MPEPSSGSPGETRFLEITAPPWAIEAAAKKGQPIEEFLSQYLEEAITSGKLLQFVQWRLGGENDIGLPS